MLVGLMAYCGLRVSEAIHLNARWIKDEEIHIPSYMECRCQECAARGHWKPKSKHGVRAVAIPEFLKPVFLKYLTRFPEGLKMTRQAAWYRVRLVCAAAGVPEVFPHALRASCATFLASKGFTAVELCQYLGWARIAMGEHYIRIAEARSGSKQKIKQIWG